MARIGRVGTTSPRAASGAHRLKPQVRSTSLHVSSFALLINGIGMLVAVIVDLITDGNAIGPLLISGAVCSSAGWLGWRLSEAHPRTSASTAFVSVTMAWVVLSVAGAMPFWLAGTFQHWDDAIFEVTSGFTATGATVLYPIEGTSRGLLFYRSATQWIGGIGVIVLAVSVLPYFGVGGLSLIAAEAPGPTAERLAPRVQVTAQRLTQVYLILTALVIGGLLLAGTSLFDAVNHAMTAVATGGFSPYDNSVAHFDSVWVELVLIFGMVGGATSFVLHWRALTGKPLTYFTSSELRAFLGTLAASILVIALVSDDGFGFWRSLRDSAFTTVSIMTTTGFGTADYVKWAQATHVIIIGLMIVGSMTGSTSGALKVLRIQIAARATRRTLRSSAHPNGVFVVRHDGKAVPEDVVVKVIALVLAYLGVFAAGILALALLDTPANEAIGGVATSMGGIGPALGRAGPAGNFLTYTRPARAVMAALMVVGRLEVFPVMLAVGAGVQRAKAIVRMR